MLSQLERSRPRRFGWRTLLGSVLVLLASAGASAVFVLHQVHTVVQDLNATKPLQVSSNALAQTSFGQPETLLLVGNDTRSVFKYYKGYVPNLANEMLLVRIDPSKPWISMMSLPRELWVPITEPNGQIFTNRLNSAYTFGTTTLLKTIKQITGLPINHVIATTFTQFERAINKLGCVYDTVDERYYHNNADGGAQYQNINLQPGYQCLNGSKAEQFVSYRHTDTSQVRDARDQSFLLAVKSQYGPQLAGNVGKFEKIFGETVQTDRGLRSQTEILNLANLLISAVGLHVRQVHFQTSPCTSTCPSGDLTATQQQIQQSVHDFLQNRPAVPKLPATAIPPKHSRGHRRGHAHHASHPRLPVTQTLSANVAAEKTAAKRIRLTAEFPSIQDLAGSVFGVSAQCSQVMTPCIRGYRIRAPDGRSYPAYVEVFSNGDLGQYYDVQGTTWAGAPLFRNPTQTVRVGNRSYSLYYDGSHLAMVAWHQYGAVYWVHNTLTDGVSNDELLAIAERTTPITAVTRSAQPTTVIRAFSMPHPAAAPAVAEPLTQRIGHLGGLVALALLPFGLIGALIRRRHLRDLRASAEAMAARAGLLEQQLATLGGGGEAMAAYGPNRVRRPPAAPTAGAGLAGAGPTIYGRSDGSRAWSRATAIMLAVTVAAIAVAVAAYVALAAGGPAQHVQRAHHITAAKPPSVPVAVLNAGTVQHAAHRLAVSLSRDHVHVVDTGNLSAFSAHRYEVLYRPGDVAQAKRLAELLRADRPTLAPLSHAALTAAGKLPRLVVVIP